VFSIGSPVKKCVALQVNDAAVSLGLDVCVSKVQYSAFIYRLCTVQTSEGGGERGEGCHPSGLLCWLPVIWSGARTYSLGEVPTRYKKKHSEQAAFTKEWQKFRFKNVFFVATGVSRFEHIHSNRLHLYFPLRFSLWRVGGGGGG
jgi:hypothetical protein